MSSGSDKDEISRQQVEMKRREQWERIEKNLNMISELAKQIANVLIIRNQLHPVHRAVTLSDPDIAFLLLSISQAEMAAMDLAEDGHSDSTQQLALERNRDLLAKMAELCDAMKSLDQNLVDTIVGKLRERL